MQRLRRVSQLGFGEQAFPGATHTRFLHSLGTMHLASKAFESVSRDLGFVPRREMARARATIRLAGLLHDLGHAPLSHSGENVLPLKNGRRRTATHEEVSVSLINHSDLADLLRREFKDLGVRPRHVAGLISARPPASDPFVVKGVSLLPLLRQLIASELDVDRMDYLIRDSYFTGVAYGRFDKDWVLSHLGAHRGGSNVGLTLDSSAIFTFEDFLLSRFHMFLMVYFHHKTIAYHRMLERFLEGAGRRIRAPSDPEAFADCDDEWLLLKIRASSSPWAKRIAGRRPLSLVVEAWDEDAVDLGRIRGDLEESLPDSCEWVDSGVEFSKYFRGEDAGSAPRSRVLLVKTSQHTTRRPLVPVDEYSDLFVRQAAGRRVLRLYCREDDVDAVSKSVATRMRT
ncbi:MAG: HD domain-containing protein [Deltaproteobacteria bacterium]|nr:HD domain-containing protein [Deltaproteobacteria bacterium]